MARPSLKLLARSNLTADYIQYVLPAIPRRKPNVWRAFLLWSQLPQGIAQRLVEYDRESRVIIYLTSKPKIHGYHSKGKIFLAEKVIDAYEKREEGSELLLESTIMHEFVHFGSYIARFALDSRKEYKIEAPVNGGKRKAGGYSRNLDGALVEVGKQFEIAAYGRDVSFLNMAEADNNIRCGSCF